jgi:hypothetical protein
MYAAHVGIKGIHSNKTACAIHVLSIFFLKKKKRDLFLSFFLKKKVAATASA